MLMKFSYPSSIHPSIHSSHIEPRSSWCGVGGRSPTKPVEPCFQGAHRSDCFTLTQQPPLPQASGPSVHGRCCNLYTVTGKRHGDVPYPPHLGLVKEDLKLAHSALPSPLCRELSLSQPGSPGEGGMRCRGACLLGQFGAVLSRGLCQAESAGRDWSS